MTSGLLAWSGPPPAGSAIARAVERAPWRGPASSPIMGIAGGVIALGTSRVERIDSLIVGVDARLFPDDDRGAPDPGAWCAEIARRYRTHGHLTGTTLSGLFAFVIVDEERRLLIAGRDLIGQRPLFWMSSGSGVLLGSEGKQVLALADRPFVVDEATAAAFAVWGKPVDPAATFCDGIKAVLPNGWLRAYGDRPPLSGYAPVTIPTRFELDLPAAVAELRRRLDRAVRRNLLGTKRPGALVSGGMDSTAVFATAAELARRGMLPSMVRAFTTSYPEAPEVDESELGGAAAAIQGVPWEAVPISLDRLVSIDEAAMELADGPVNPGTSVLRSVFDAVAQSGIDRLQTGDGGNEFTEWSYEDLALSLLNHEWGVATQWLRHAVVTKDRAIARHSAEALLRRVLRGRTLDYYYRFDPADYDIRIPVEALEREAAWRGMTLAMPMFDPEIALFIAGLRFSLRWRNGMDKYVMRQTLAGRLPASILERRETTSLSPAIRRMLGSDDDLRAGPELAARTLQRWRQLVASGLHSDAR